ncbi:MAG: hypothetical protein JRI23_30355 [Deltaproteobacteria bacterium]|jgi:uncharacterized membrane protein YebE (DUF533 family)|nr:hypothetical protein [Deltaproteobacteria bacterium]MBW2536476.1 hypothetical protein [Deltaproteobacteria bacterium]
MSFDPAEHFEAIEIDQLETLVEVMYLAADADGEFDTAEQRDLASSIREVAKGTKHEEALSGDRLEGLLDRLAHELSVEGRDARLAAVKQRLPELAHRKAAFGLSVRVTAADGIVRTSEREFIMDLATALEIDRDEAADLVRQITTRT